MVTGRRIGVAWRTIWSLLLLVWIDRRIVASRADNEQLRTDDQHGVKPHNIDDEQLAGHDLYHYRGRGPAPPRTDLHPAVRVDVHLVDGQRGESAA
ncbi:hypothetical protein QNM97_22335 [Gordonia sp. L191]|uniref:hypothetical protein n=1 Tax=Gordonia sp. L191 TaxID=2982699 RepID=UPI0024C08448|nr:hypothetical protein [Gordonia sp. L191]WHU46682.1 hypothetical protein QNM97_22335 [Gordonia sp. L191]